VGTESGENVEGLNPIKPTMAPLPAALILVAMACGALQAAVVNLGTYKGCAATDADFTFTPLAKKGTDTEEPLKMGFNMRPGGAVDVYFVERKGAVKKYDGETKTVSLLGTVPCAIGNEDGLTGIAVDPDYQRNRYLYFSYGFQGVTDTSFRISRIPVGANGLDLAAEKVLIKIPSKRNQPHTGGAMQFDAYGDLWVTVGDNGSSEAGPGNTADLRGGILRIHPDDRLPAGYSIPAGNFGAHFAAKLQAQGNATLAKDYADPAKVRPEIYVKGTRNAYSMSLDPVRRWLSWGDVGPDFGAVSEENNLVKEPFYTGWPYFAGKLDLTTIYGTNFPKNNRAAPVNATPIAGVRQLPANREPIYVREQNCAIDGPILRYDGANAYAGQIPPQLNRKWIVGDCNGSYGTHLLTLNDKGDSVIADVRAFDLFHVAVVVDIQQGPDGAIYYIGWQSGIYRGDYKGQCKDPALLAEKTGCADPNDPKYDAKLDPAFHDLRACASATSVSPIGPDPDRLAASPEGFAVRGAGPHEIRILDARGRVVFEAHGDGPANYALPSGMASGAYRAMVTSEDGSSASAALPFLGR
jgi:glucose/arabinose dehydrogenase